MQKNLKNANILKVLFALTNRNHIGDDAYYNNN